MLAALFFITDWADYRLWVLFALGPALRTMADRTPAAAQRPARLRAAAPAGP
jgi:hypothetical protein